MLALRKQNFALVVCQVLILLCEQQTNSAAAVSVQKFQVPDVLLLTNTNQRHAQLQFSQNKLKKQATPNSVTHSNEVKFECLVAFDRRLDKNLVVKWLHDDKLEPIVQFIPELAKRSVGHSFRQHVVNASFTPLLTNAHYNNNNNNNQHDQYQAVQNLFFLDAGFSLTKPSRELAGKYTCQALSEANEDSKSKKMIVYSPPRVFHFNATRRAFPSPHPHPPLPAAGRLEWPASRDDSSQLQQSMLATGAHQADNDNAAIPYVNVAQVRRVQQQLQKSQSTTTTTTTTAANITTKPSVKLICDIDMVFPQPEVSIYKLSVDSRGNKKSQKLERAENKLELREPSGLYHVQVISVLDESQLLQRQVYFECVFSLPSSDTQSLPSDSKRTLIYSRSLLNDNYQSLDNQELIVESLEQQAANAAATSGSALSSSSSSSSSSSTSVRHLNLNDKQSIRQNLLVISATLFAAICLARRF